jgi:membrane-associated protease RseP (regulator of RpoE activity)
MSFASATHGGYLFFTSLYMIGHRPHGARLYLGFVVAGLLLLFMLFRRSRRR